MAYKHTVHGHILRKTIVKRQFWWLIWLTDEITVHIDSRLKANISTMNSLTAWYRPACCTCHKDSLCSDGDREAPSSRWTPPSTPGTPSNSSSSTAHRCYLLSLTMVGEICLFVLQMSHHSRSSEGQRLSLEENILNFASNTLWHSFCQVTNKTRHRASTSTRWHFAFGAMLSQQRNPCTDCKSTQ